MIGATKLFMGLLFLFGTADCAFLKGVEVERVDLEASVVENSIKGCLDLAQRHPAHALCALKRLERDGIDIHQMIDDCTPLTYLLKHSNSDSFDGLAMYPLISFLLERRVKFNGVREGNIAMLTDACVFICPSDFLVVCFVKEQDYLIHIKNELFLDGYFERLDRDGKVNWQNQSLEQFAHDRECLQHVSDAIKSNRHNNQTFATMIVALRGEHDRPR
ncbi:MAG: hypothetical protein H6679_00765 [Epsilonproteobacteria bacterium]|nr:hypothetical protein [Campylobacterota bacterium]